MKNEQQSQNLFLRVDPRSTFRNNFVQPVTNVFFARQVDHARWKTRNIDQNLQRIYIARKVKGFVARNSPPLVHLASKGLQQEFSLCLLGNWAKKSLSVDKLLWNWYRLGGGGV